MSSLDLDLSVRQYIANKWALVPIQSGSKGPNGKGWNLLENCVTTEAQCPRVKENVGLAHLFSRTCAMDFDDMVKAAAWLKTQGIEFSSLWESPDAVRISSGKPNRGKLLYKLPEEVRFLRTHNMQALGIELRCANADGTATVQDVLPPSVHPETGRSYVWELAEPMIGDENNPPVLPPAVLRAWLALSKPERTERVPPPSGAGVAAVRKLLGEFDPSEAYPDWVRRGMALHHEFSGSDEGLALWDEWSSASASLYVGIEDLDTHWRTFGKDVGEVVTLDSLRAEVSKRPMRLDDFDEVPDEAPPAVRDLGPVKRERFPVLSLGEFVQREAPAWLIKGVLPRASMAVMFGASGSGKSFLALDLAAAIAQGEDWRGHRTARGRVVYICAEGASGFQRRVEAYARQRGVELDDLPIGVVANAPNFTLGEDIKDLEASVSRFGAVDLIVVDTYARVMPGANENDSKDVGKVINNCEHLHLATGAMVLLVHHSGKDLTKGARGSNALRAAADAEIEVSRFKDSREAVVTKMKDGEDGEVMAFKLNTIVLGVDGDGDDLTSCVVEHMAAAPPRKEAAYRPTNDAQITIIKYLEALPAADKKMIKKADLWLNVKELFAVTSSARQRPDVAFKRAIDKLVEKCVLEDDGLVITLM